MPELCKTLSLARMMRHTLDFSWLVFSVQKTNVSNNYSAVSRVTMNPESKGSFLCSNRITWHVKYMCLKTSVNYVLNNLLAIRSVALKEYGNYLTDYEQNEIKAYSEIYFVGADCQKLQPSSTPGAYNYG
jgi:hypothetical protein